MKYTRFLLAAFVMLLAFSCSIQELDNKSFSDDDSVEYLTFTASFGDIPETKTEFESSDASSWPIYWLPGDAINIFYGSRSKARFETSEDLTSAGPVTEFEGYLRAATGAADENGNVTTQNFWGLYPYNENNTCDGSSVTLTIPSEQTGVAGTFANGLNPSVACSPNMGLTFYNVGSWFIFTITQENVVSATLTGANGETLVGKVKVSMDENNRPKIDEVTEGSTVVTMTPEGDSFEIGEYYCMVILPGTFDDGVVLTLTKSDGSRAECAIKRTDGNPMVIERSKWARKKNADQGLVYVQPNNVIYYTSTDGEIVTPNAQNIFGANINAQDVFGANIIDNKYENGHGVITFDGDVTSIGGYAFYNRSTLSSIIIPNSVTTIGNLAFSGCSGFTGDLILPEGLTTIGHDAFANCSGFTGDLILPEGLTSIGNHAFHNCCGFTGDLTLPAGVTAIGDYAFYGCSGFTGELTLPEGLTTIRGSVFSYCSGFTGDLILPEGLTSIGMSAFYGCSGFTGELTLPESLISIGNSAFYDCYGFTGNLDLPSGLTSIADNAFAYCSGFTGDLTLPSGLTSIGGGAFYYCSGFTGDLILPEGLTSIGDQAFYYCGFTGDLILPSGLTTIGGYAFRGCSRFTGDLTLPEGLASIGDYAFSGCSRFTGDLTLPEGLTSVGDYAFYSCSSLSSINVSTVTPPGIGGYAFDETNDCPIFVPYGSLDSYKSAEGWCEYAERIQAAPEAVDLGLPSGVKWASFNLGASKPEECGNYYAWGETSPKDDYSWETYKWCNGSETSLTKYNTSLSYGTVDNKTQLELSDDAARANWGGNWRMPTDAEWTELRHNCTWTWTTQNGVNGHRVTSNINGNSIFLPATGELEGTSLIAAGSFGDYWSSTLNTDFQYGAYIVYFGSDVGGVDRSYGRRCYGESVRPVTD